MSRRRLREERARGSACAALLIVASAVVPSLTSAEELPRGTVVERVVCKADAQETYALYLPSAYVETRPWPILYIFDPGARGPRAAARFQSGAEKYGFILAASNNSRNGPVDASLTAARAMWEDTHGRFALDDRRIYTAGYSGGARLATLVAELLKVPVAGVIACSGGFPDQRPPTRETSFAYFATAGDTDFNYLEMVALDKTLEKLGLPHRLTIFDGPHSWPPEDICAQALAWMRLREAARRIAPDENLVTRSFDRRLAGARQARAAGQLVEADRELQSVTRDFRGLRDTGAVGIEIAEIEKDPGFRKAAAAEERRDTDERAAVSRLLRRFDALLQPEPPTLPRLLADLEIARWKKLAATADRDASLSAQRILAMLFFHAASTLPQELAARKDFQREILALSVAVEIQAEDATVWYNRGCAEARVGDKRRALDDLRAAVARGFQDRGMMESDADLESLRGEAQFQAILEALPEKPSGKS